MKTIYFSSIEELYNLLEYNTSNDVVFKSNYSLDFIPYNDLFISNEFETDFIPLS